MIIIEGVIGAGKSTLTEKVAKKFNLKPFFEPVESNPYLEDYYKNPKEFALKMQFYLLTERFRQHKQAIHYEWTIRHETIFDRSIYGDMVFAKVNFVQGNMTTLDYKSYMNMRNLMLEECLAPNVCVYLDVSTEKIMENIANRGRECEKNIPYEYIELLKTHYEDMLDDLIGRGTDIVRVDFENFDTTELYEILWQRLRS